MPFALSNLPVYSVVVTPVPLLHFGVSGGPLVRVMSAHWVWGGVVSLAGGFITGEGEDAGTGMGIRWEGMQGNLSVGVLGGCSYVVETTTWITICYDLEGGVLAVFEAEAFGDDLRVEVIGFSWEKTRTKRRKKKRKEIFL